MFLRRRDLPLSFHPNSCLNFHASLLTHFFFADPAHYDSLLLHKVLQVHIVTLKVLNQSLTFRLNQAARLPRGHICPIQGYYLA